jgi:hypothetical protein
LRESFAVAVLGVAAAFLLSAPTFAADTTDLETKLTINIGGLERTLSLEEAKAALNIPRSASH